MKTRRSDTAVGHYVMTRSRSKLLATNGDGSGGAGCNLHLTIQGNNNNHSMLKKCGVSLVQGPGRRVLRRHKRSRSINTTPLLPDDIIFHILILLPAQVLHNVMRCVCRSWYRLISDPVFVRQHLRRQYSSSSPGFFGFHRFTPNFRFHVELTTNVGWEFQVTESRFPFFEEVKATCHGLVLLQDFMRSGSYQRQLYFANPITFEKVALPPLQSNPLIGDCSSALAYVPSIASYKVVKATAYGQLLVLTVGIDSVWRVLDTKNVEHLKFFFINRSIVYCIDRHIYWFNRVIPTRVLALDIESETLRTLPTMLDNSSDDYALLTRMDGWLAVVNFKYLSYGEVWALTCVEQVNWTKMFNIQMATLSHNIKKMAPLCLEIRNCQLIFCSQTGEVAFKVHGKSFGLVWHDVKTGDFKVYQINRELYSSLYEHVNSLVSPRNYF